MMDKSLGYLPSHLRSINVKSIWPSGGLYSGREYSVDEYSNDNKSEFRSKPGQSFKCITLGGISNLL